jgi:hypothetical protein
MIGDKQDFSRAEAVIKSFDGRQIGFAFQPRLELQQESDAETLDAFSANPQFRRKVFKRRKQEGKEKNREGQEVAEQPAYDDNAYDKIN